jgi:hypothetical protein
VHVVDEDDARGGIAAHLHLYPSRGSAGGAGGTGLPGRRAASDQASRDIEAGSDRERAG